MSVNLFKQIDALVQPYAKKDIRLVEIFKKIAQAVTQDETTLATTQTIAQFQRIRFEIPGVLANGTDVLPARYSIRLPRDSSNNAITSGLKLQKIGITAKVAPGADLVLDCLVSNDFGTTFKSLFSSDPANKPTLPAGLTRITNTFFSIPELFDADMLSMDIISADGVAAGVEFDLMGRLVPL